MLVSLKTIAHIPNFKNIPIFLWNFFYVIFRKHDEYASFAYPQVLKNFRYYSVCRVKPNFKMSLKIVYCG
jgi:hypothetical protein